MTRIGCSQDELIESVKSDEEIRQALGMPPDLTDSGDDSQIEALFR